MKILHVIVTLDRGGAESALFRLVTHDHHNEHRVICLTESDYFGDRLRQLGITVDSLEMASGRITISGIRTFLHILKHDQPDIVQTWMYHADLFAGVLTRLCSRMPLVWGIRVSKTENVRYSLSTRLVVKLCYRLSRLLPHSIVSCAKSAMLHHVSKGYPAERITVVPNGYDTDWLKRDEAGADELRRSIGIDEQAVVVGSVGRWHPQKNHAALISAFAAIVKQRSELLILLLVGPNMTDKNKELCSLIEEACLSDSVILLGVRDDLPAVYSSMDLHVLASLDEGFPNVVAEAMACETPCVVTDVGDAADIVAECGWVTVAGRDDQLKETITKALDERHNRDRWQDLRKLSRESIVSRFSLDTMARGFDEVWQNCRL